MSVTQLPTEKSQPEPKKARRNSHLVLSFSEEDKVGTTQPHDDALLITLRIGGYDVKRMMVDGGSVAEIMYPNLYKGLKLKPKNLMPYDSLLMSFDRKLVIPKGHDQAAHPDWPRDCGGELYRSQHLFSIHSHCWQTLASHLRSRCLLLALEGKVPVEGSDSRDPRSPTHGKAVYGGCRLTLAR